MIPKQKVLPVTAERAGNSGPPVCLPVLTGTRVYTVVPRKPLDDFAEEASAMTFHRQWTPCGNWVHPPALAERALDGTPGRTASSSHSFDGRTGDGER